MSCGPRRAADARASFVTTLTWLHAAAVGDAPLLTDRKLKFLPDLDGFALPNHLHWLLLPFSKRTVGFYPCSNRRHVVTGVQPALVKYPVGSPNLAPRVSRSRTALAQRSDCFIRNSLIQR